MNALQLLFNRKAIAWVALLVVGIAQCPMPMVSPTASVVFDDEPFPCQNHACGCASAAECWSSCCCYTPQERLAWVRKRGIKPPELLLAAVEAEHSKGEQSTAACKHCIAAKDETGKQASLQTAGDSEEKTAAVSNQKIKFVRVVDAMKCRGLSPSIALLPPAVVSESQTICFAEPLVVDRLESKDVCASSATLSIDPPRPKGVLRG